MPDKPIILFDGICNLCNAAIQFVIKRDPAAVFSFASLQSDAGQQLLKKFDLPVSELNSFVLIQHDQSFTRSTAALKVAKQLKGPTKLLYGFIIVPAFIRNFVYKIIAANRYRWFGKRDSCMLPSIELKERFLN